MMTDEHPIDRASRRSPGLFHAPCSVRREAQPAAPARVSRICRDLLRFRRAESGVASIEFALLGSIMLLLFAGSFDLVYMVGAKRDADRASMLFARSMASCPNSSCMSDLIYKVIKRESNLLVRYPTAKIDLYMIQRQSNAIQTCSGTQKVLADADVLATALNIMKDNDVGAAVVLTTTHTSILPKSLVKYISSSGASYRQYTVDVMANQGTVC